MKNNKESFSVSRMCHALGVSRSGYYDWLNAPESQRAVENRKLLVQIQDIFKESKNNYGSPKVLVELVKRGYNCGHNRVARMMKLAGIKSKVVKKFRPRGLAIKAVEAVPNVLERRFNWAKLS